MQVAVCKLHGADLQIAIMNVLTCSQGDGNLERGRQLAGGLNIVNMVRTAVHNILWILVLFNLKRNNVLNDETNTTIRNLCNCRTATVTIPLRGKSKYQLEELPVTSYLTQALKVSTIKCKR